MNESQRKNLVKLAGIKPKPPIEKVKLSVNNIYENVLIILAVIFIASVLIYNILVTEIFRKSDWQIELK
jgi:hypothetical protein